MMGPFLKLGDLFINVDRILYVDFCMSPANVVFEDEVVELDHDQTELLKRYLTEITQPSAWIDMDPPVDPENSNRDPEDKSYFR